MFTKKEIIEILKDDTKNEWLFSLADKTRKEKGLTQSDVAKVLQTSQSNIHKYENAKCLITTMYALEFVKQYHYSLDKMFGRE